MLPNESYADFLYNIHQKILKGHGWLQPTHISPIKNFNHNKAYTEQLESVTCIIDTNDQLLLEAKLGFLCWQDIDKILFVIITCRPDVFQSVIKFSQYNTKSNSIHYFTVKTFLNTPRIPSMMISTTEALSSILIFQIYHVPAYHLLILMMQVVFVYSDWEGDVHHHCSISGICLFISWSLVVYSFCF